MAPWCDLRELNWCIPPHPCEKTSDKSQQIPLGPCGSSGGGPLGEAPALNVYQVLFQTFYYHRAEEYCSLCWDICHVGFVISRFHCIDVVPVAFTVQNAHFMENFKNWEISHIFTRLKIHHHIYVIANMPPIDIPVLAVCRMFVTWT